MTVLAFECDQFLEVLLPSRFILHLLPVRTAELENETELLQATQARRGEGAVLVSQPLARNPLPNAAGAGTFRD
jgi:hypothetical protein